MNVLKSMLVLGACCAGGFAFANPGVTPEGGVWVKRHYDLQFMGFTSTYSCDGLAGKLKVLVKAAGARSDLKASPGACASGFGSPDQFANASVTFYALVPSSKAKPDEANGSPDQGIWQTVEIAPRKPLELQPGDCELVEQFRDHVLPLFTRRNVDERITCIPHQQSGSSYFLRFEVFRPANLRQP